MGDGIRRRTAGGGIPAYAGMTWVRDGYDGTEGAGMTGGGVGMTTGGFVIRRRPILRKRKRNRLEESLAIERRLRA